MIPAQQAGEAVLPHGDLVEGLGHVVEAVEEHVHPALFHVVQGHVAGVEDVEGDSRRTHFRLTADTTGAKNNQQGWGSSQQYGMRYNMIALLNIVTEAKEDADNDGFPGPGENVTPAQLKVLIQMADDAGADKAKFCEVMKVDSMADIPASRFGEAKTQLQRKLNAKAKKAAASDFPGDR